MATPTDYGRRLIPQILDDLASAEPDRIVYSVAASSDISQGLQHISARSLAKAVDKTAWWLHNEVGKSTSFQAVGYIGPNDLRYVLLTYASIKAGYKTLFLSPKNSTEGALAVLEAAECTIWVQPCGQPCLPQVEEFLRQRPMKVLNMLEPDELLDAELADNYPYNKTFDEVAQDPFCVLHTSGSTGLPKPITWSHALIGTMDAVRLLPPTEGNNGMPPWTSLWKERDRLYTAFPMSHGAGLLMNIVIPSLFGMHCVIGPVGVIPNMALIESLIDYGNIDVWSIVPSLVDELGETPDVLAKFKLAKFICASGGPVSPVSASKVNEVVRVLNMTGTTEGLFIGNLVVDREDWLYFAFHPFSGFEFREVEPGVYEHWVVRNRHWLLFQGIFQTFPDLQEINLKDLYVKHPTKPDHWAYKGRSDDIVVLSNGYKISPLDTEAFITTHPAINGCLVVGTGKPQAALLVELKDPSTGNEELFESIWLKVQQANAASLHKDQLHRDYIMFTEVDKPFVRTDKGTVKRRATLTLYADYIERFYSSRDSEPHILITVDTTSIQSIQNAVRHILSSLSPAVQHIPLDTDLFTLGLDSLLVFQATRSLRAALGLQEQLGPRHLYANPTIAKFSSALSQLVARAGTTYGTYSDDRLAKMKQLLGKHNSEQSLKLNGFDLIMPNIYIQMLVYIPLRKGVSFEQAFMGLQRGLARTIALIPALDGKLITCSKVEAGYRKGHLRMISPAPPLPSLDASGPRQLTYKDLSHTLPPFDELQNSGFVASTFRDDVVLKAPRYAAYPVDVMIARANFVEGGCLLATGIHHSCADGVGVLTAIKAWAESCRYEEGDTSATCSWLDPESMNHSLPHVLWEHEGYARPVQDIDPATWGYLGQDIRNQDGITKAKTLPSAPAASLTPLKYNRQLELRTFNISPKNLEKLKREVAIDPEVKGAVPSASDVVQAVFWRGMIRARYRMAKDQGKTFGPDEVSALELPIDGRPYFSPLLPPTYMGNMVVINQATMPAKTLCSPETSIGRIALHIREATARITPQLVHDAFTLVENVPDYTQIQHISSRLDIDGLGSMISNMMLFPMRDVSFGGEFFDNKGVPDAVRPLIDGSNSAFRMCVILPTRKNGGVELVFGLFPEELELLMEDGEFTKYATFLG